MTDKGIKQTNVLAILSKLNFLDFPFVTHPGGHSALQAVSRAGARAEQLCVSSWSATAWGKWTRAERINRSSWSHGDFFPWPPLFSQP